MNTVEWAVADDNPGYYGGDITHALAAWTSTSRDLTDEKRARIPAHLKMLAENGHTSPFEKSYLEFLITCDTATHIQIIKHRIGVSVNGESARYKELKDDKSYIPYDWPIQNQLDLQSHMQSSYYLYHHTIDELMAQGFTRKRAKESARFFLPYANQITLNVSFNFNSFQHFQKLRNEEHAQDEIHGVADTMLQLVRDTGRFNLSLDAFGL